MPVARITILLSAGLITIGFSPILVRFATDVEPLALAAMRTVFAIVFLLPFWLRKGATVRQLDQSGAKPLLLLAAGVSLGMHFTLWIASLHYTSVASAAVLVTVHPVMLIAAESILFRKKFRAMVWAGVFIAFAGSILLGLADDTHQGQFPNAVLGNTLAFSAAVLFVIYFLLGRKIRQKTEWIDYVFHVYLYAAVTCSVLTILWAGGLPFISPTSVLVGVGLALGPTILGHGSMNYAVKYISPTLLSTLILAEAVISSVAAYFIFGEIPNGFSIGSMILIMTGVSLTWFRRMSGKQTAP